MPEEDQRRDYLTKKGKGSNPGFLDSGSEMAMYLPFKEECEDGHLMTPIFHTAVFDLNVSVSNSSSLLMHTLSGQ